MEDKPRPMTAEEMEAQIRLDMAVTRKRRLTVEDMAREERKFDILYHAAVMDKGDTAAAYMWREVYRRLLAECTSD